MTKSLLLFSIFSLLPLVTFSSSFTSNNPITTTTTNTYNAANGDPVRDEDANYVQTGAEYRIYSPPIYGGVYLECPNGVFLHEDTTNEGMPVKFEAGYDAYSSLVLKGLEINIMFSIPTCDNQTVWKADHQTARSFIVTGGSTETNTKKSWFQIESARSFTGPYYKLLYCACVGEFVDNICPEIDCKYVGVTHDLHSQKPRLFLSTDDDPLEVVFKKVESDDHQ